MRSQGPFKAVDVFNEPRVRLGILQRVMDGIRHPPLIRISLSLQRLDSPSQLHNPCGLRGIQQRFRSSLTKHKHTWCPQLVKRAIQERRTCPQRRNLRLLRASQQRLTAKRRHDGDLFSSQARVLHCCTKQLSRHPLVGVSCTGEFHVRVVDDEQIFPGITIRHVPSTNGEGFEHSPHFTQAARERPAADIGSITIGFGALTAFISLPPVLTPPRLDSAAARSLTDAPARSFDSVHSDNSMTLVGMPPQAKYAARCGPLRMNHDPVPPRLQRSREQCRVR